MTIECAAITTEPETSGYRRVLEHLRDLLVNGGVETGHRLPSERELALSLGVSRPAVREAVRAMEMIGVLETRHGRASTVRVPDALVLGEFFSLALAQQPAIIDDIVEVRIALERQALRLACTRATPEDQCNLEEALEEIEATIDDVSGGGHADLRFHTQLVAAAILPRCQRFTARSRTCSNGRMSKGAGALPTVPRRGTFWSITTARSMRLSALAMQPWLTI